ncbi:MAG: formylglycine-generating enzyme family protein, partial [Anaerolineae bacterium]
ETWANSYGRRGNRVVVTSRIVGYDEAPLAGDFRAYTLSALGPEEMERFAGQWCVAYQRWADPDQPEEMAVERGRTEAASLVAEIRADPKVESLASNPLLITIIALIHYKGTRLPDHRVELYDLCIQTLVETWRETRSEAGPVGKPLRIANEIKVLAPFALWLQKQAPGPGGAARRDAVRARLVELLARQFKGDREAAETEADLFLELGQRQTGLLVERGEGWFGFFHPTFKEYLAARACVLEGQMKGVTSTWKVLRPHLDDALWHEVILLTVGYKAIIEAQDEAAAYLVRQIAAEPDERGENVVLAGRCLADIGRGLVPDDCWEETVEKLIPVMQDLAPDGLPNEPPVIPIPTRYAAAETLDRLGWLPPDLNAFVGIPIPNLQSPIYVARYPVTNAQFALFMAAGGYEERGRRWWSDQGWEWRKQGKRRWPERGTDQPKYWDHPRFGKSRRGYPVVGVSWYEANAYCAWLSELLERHRAGEELEAAHRDLIADLPEDAAVVRLPTEEEWVAAAGGAKGERYPWGPQWHESHANTYEGGIGGTTPVGMYPSGQSPPGVWDLGGNVWEWMASWYDEKQRYRALRGGSWLNDHKGARVGGRIGDYPGDSSNLSGFRVVASPALF